MLIVALVLAVIGLASLVTAVVTSNELIAWVCIAASVIGVLLLIIDAVRERSRRESTDDEESDDESDSETTAEVPAVEDYPEEETAASEPATSELPEVSEAETTTVIDPVTDEPVQDAEDADEHEPR